MSKTNTKQFSKNFLREVWEPFEKEIKKSSSYEDIIRVLESVLTKEEKKLVEKRLAIKLLLNRETPIKEISRRLDVNRKTIWFMRDGFKRRKYKKLSRHISAPSYGRHIERNSGMPRYRFIRKVK